MAALPVVPTPGGSRWWLWGLLGLAGAGAGVGAVLLTRRHRRRNFAGVEEGDVPREPWKARIKGTISCPVFQYNAESGRNAIVDRRVLPGVVSVACDERGRCAVSIPDCPEKDGEKAVTRRVKDLRLKNAGVSRGRDNSGGWNTSAHIGGKIRWFGNKQERPEADFQVWDHADAEGVPFQFYAGVHVPYRPYPRADEEIRYFTAHLSNLDRQSKSEVGEVFVHLREAAGYIGRHGYLSREEAEAGPAPDIFGRRLQGLAESRPLRYVRPHT